MRTLSNNFKGDFSDKKGKYELFQVTYEDDPCNCHPETCCCYKYSWAEHEKRYKNGEIIKIKKHPDDWVKKR
jgi:hypothetical protein